MKRSEEALADLNQALSLDPQRAGSYHSRGLTYRDMKRSDEALADFNQLLSLDPQEAAFYHNRGLIYREMKRSEEALADFNQALSLDPQRAGSYHNRGLTYRDMKRYGEALADFDIATSLDAYSARIVVNRAETYYLIRNYNKSIEDFECAAQVNPEEFSWNNYGLYLSYMGYYPEAMQNYQKDLDNDPNNHYVLYNMAVVMVRWKGLTKVQTYIDSARTKLMSLQNSDTLRGSALYGRGGIKALEGENNQALEYLQQAILLELEAIKWAYHDIAWIDLRSDARFQALISKEI